MAEGDRLNPDEMLYRTVSEENIDGDRILQEAIELPECSFDRSSMTAAEDVLARRPQDGRVMEVLVSNLPSPILREETKTLYSYLAIHRPERSNLAHSQVELTSPDGKLPPKMSPAFKSRALAALADRIRVRPVTLVQTPTP